MDWPLTADVLPVHWPLTVDSCCQRIDLWQLIVLPVHWPLTVDGYCLWTDLDCWWCHCYQLIDLWQLLLMPVGCPLTVDTCCQWINIKVTLTAVGVIATSWLTFDSWWCYLWADLWQLIVTVSGLTLCYLWVDLWQLIVALSGLTLSYLWADLWQLILAVSCTVNHELLPSQPFVFQTQWAGGFPGASAKVSIAVGGEWHFHESQSWARNHAAPYHGELVIKVGGGGGLQPENVLSLVWVRWGES